MSDLTDKIRAAQNKATEEILVEDLRLRGLADVQIIHNDTGPRRSREYLNDGVYVEHDDIQMWLFTERGGQRHEVAVDRTVYQMLKRYATLIGMES